MITFKKLALMALCVILIGGCSNQVSEDVADVRYIFVEGEAAAEILSQKDDYIEKLSAFDYASKFKTEHVLSQEEFFDFYLEHVLDWSEVHKNAIDEAMDKILPKLDALGMELPQISFILTTPEEEGGAAYTRHRSIILKSRFIGTSTNPNLERLIVHEIFHIYSRENKELRDALYGVIGFLPCEELMIPEELKDYTIANPDAPNNNYYIELEYENETLAFVPIIYSGESYNIESGESFFRYLRDEFLAVEIIDNKPIPIRRNDGLLIVNKQHVEGFYDKIGMNTFYTYHPEETMADNFVALVFEDDVRSPWVIENLREVLRRGDHDGF